MVEPWPTFWPVRATYGCIATAEAAPSGILRISTGSARVSLSLVDGIALAAVTPTGFWAGEGRQAKLNATKLAMAKATALRRGTESIKHSWPGQPSHHIPSAKSVRALLRERCSRT